jgi:uncharacterized membrane protein HdeD (DUF308 family)
MSTTQIVVAVAGVVILLSGVIQLFANFKLRGRAPWRGPAVSAAALSAYGLLALSGLVVDGSTLGAVLVWVVVIGMWFGLWLRRRERQRPVQ